MKETPLGKMLDKKPDFVIKNAVKGMLPKNPLGRSMIKNSKSTKATPMVMGHKNQQL
jgi:large subunit ribosomal protein L13